MQVKSGTLFDNILICDDPEYANKVAEETWGKNKDVSSFPWLLEQLLRLFTFFSVTPYMFILQAEKAAFDEAEKKKEEEV